MGREKILWWTVSQHWFLISVLSCLLETFLKPAILSATIINLSHREWDQISDWCLQMGSASVGERKVTALPTWPRWGLVNLRVHSSIHIIQSIISGETVYLSLSDCFNKIPHTGRLKQSKYISHSSRIRVTWDQDSSWESVDSSVFAVFSHDVQISLRSLLIKALIPFMRLPLAWPNYLLIAPSTNTITLWIRASTHEFWSDTNIQSMELPEGY